MLDRSSDPNLIRRATNFCVKIKQIAYTFDAGPNAVLIAKSRKVAVELMQGLLYCFPPKPDTDMKR